MLLNRGWKTDIAVLRLSGSDVTVLDDCWVVSSPANPYFYWGNFVMVTDDTRLDEPLRWVERFRQDFPDARHVAIGLPRLPDVVAWREAGLTVDTDEVLATETLPALLPCPSGFTVRPLTSDADWEGTIASDLRANEVSGEHDPVVHERFLRDQAATRRRLCDAGAARWFGAFTSAGEPVSSLGIVVCDDVARYQSVGTDPSWRKRGLAGHLLGVAARWAHDQGCTSWVIVTETTNPAGRLYRSVGFEPDVVNVAAWRWPG